MIDSMTKVKDLEREVNVKPDLTDIERQLIEAVRYLLDKTGGELHPVCYENYDLRNSLRKQVVHDGAYSEKKGEGRHDVGASQSEAMAIFREARQLLTPNDQHNRQP